MAKIIAKEVAKEIVAQQSKADPALPKEKLALTCTIVGYAVSVYFAKRTYGE